MRTSPWAFALACVASAASAQQRAPEATGTASRDDTLRITRRQAIAASLLENPQLEVARQQVSQVRAQRVEGIAIPDPSFTAAYDSLPSSLHLYNPQVSRPLNFGLVVPFPDKFRLRNTIGVANIHSSEAQLRLLQGQIASQAGQLYDSVLVTRMHRRDLTEARGLAADFLTKTQARFAAGTVPRLDVIKAQVEVAQAENDLIANARDVANAQASLDRVIGRPLGQPIVPLDSLDVPTALPDLDAIEQAALRTRPEIADLVAQQQAAKANTKLTREMSILPDLTFNASRDASLAVPTWYSIGIAMPLPIFFWQHTRGDFSETQHKELQLAASLRDTRAAIGQDVRSAYATADAALRQVIFIRDQLLPSTREAYRVASVSYGLGGLSALDVLDARRDLLTAESQFADALAAANSARSDLERAAGVPLSTFAPGVPRE
jgi:outer membrane protein, heavy metal efflux system